MTRPTPYNGKTSLSEYLNHFDLCVAINGWSPSQAGAFLGVSLDGDARRLLEGLSPDTEAGYIQLRQRLKDRFEPANATGMHKAQLRGLERKAEQDIAAFASDILKLVRKSYPQIDPSSQETLAKDRFIDALSDPKLRLWVRQARPKDFAEAIAAAIEGETSLEDAHDRRGGRARVAAEAKPVVEEDRIDQLVELVKRIASPQGRGRGRRGNNPGRQRLCYRCQEPGHFAYECRAAAPVPRENRETSAVAVGPIGSTEEMTPTEN